MGWFFCWKNRSYHWDSEFFICQEIPVRNASATFVRCIIIDETGCAMAILLPFFVTFHYLMWLFPPVTKKVRCFFSVRLPEGIYAIPITYMTIMIHGYAPSRISIIALNYTTWHVLLIFPYWEWNNHLNWRSPSFFRGVGLNHQPDGNLCRSSTSVSRFPGCGPGNAGAASEALGEGEGLVGLEDCPGIPCWIHVNHRMFHENWHSLRYPVLFLSLSHHYLIISSNNK